MGENRTSELTYELEPSKSPKWIDLTRSGRTTLGIYELKGDRRSICMPDTDNGGSDRSTAFESKEGSPSNSLLKFERVKPSE